MLGLPSPARANANSLCFHRPAETWAQTGQRLGADWGNAKAWWTLCCMRCSPPWGRKTWTTRWGNDPASAACAAAGAVDATAVSPLSAVRGELRLHYEEPLLSRAQRGAWRREIPGPVGPTGPRIRGATKKKEGWCWLLRGKEGQRWEDGKGKRGIIKLLGRQNFYPPVQQWYLKLTCWWKVATKQWPSVQRSSLLQLFTCTDLHWNHLSTCL